MNEQIQRKTKPLVCTVISDKMNKSRVALLEKLIKHPKYKKYIKKRIKIMFHDENNETKINDKVLIQCTRPISAHKSFRLVKIIEKSK